MRSVPVGGGFSHLVPNSFTVIRRTRLCDYSGSNCSCNASHVKGPLMPYCVVRAHTGRFLPDHSTAVSLLDRPLHHNVLVVTKGESFRIKEALEGRNT